MITKSDVSDNQSESSPLNIFSDNAFVGFYGWEGFAPEQNLQRLVFQVSKKPSQLENHIERIYFCFKHDLKEQLFGALLDLLIALNKNGTALAKRMVLGSKAKLSEQQFASLSHFLGNMGMDVNLLPCSRFSVFGKGLLSVANLVELNDDRFTTEHDPLALAHDYIEYSQLDSAIHVLEQALFADPGRAELHGELLSLYRSTRNLAQFEHTYQALRQKNIELPAGWDQLRGFFMTTANHEK